MVEEKDIEGIFEPDPTVEPDRESKKEEKELTNDEKRTEGVKQTAHWIFLWILRIGFFLIVAVLIVRVYHIIMPESLRWLKYEDVSQMDKFLFSSSLGGIIGKYFGNLFGKRDTK